MTFSVVIYGVHFYFFHGGYFGFDDIEYCRLADSIVKGSFSHDNLYAHRYACFIPLALSYFVWGVNDFANFILGLSIFIITLFLLQRSIKEVPIHGQWLGALALIFTPMYLMYIEKPMPDIMVALGFLISFLSYLSLKFKTDLFRNHSLWFSFGVIIMFFAKETFLIFYPYFFGLLLFDIYRTINLQFWKNTILLLTTFIIIYCVLSYFILGDSLIRINHLFSGQYISACSYDLLPLTVTLKRIGYQFWLEMTRNLFFISLCFIPFLWNNEDSKVRFVTRSFTALLFLANFMSISYTSYVPMCPDPRHHMYILPVGAMVFGYGMTNVYKLSSHQLSTILSILGVLFLISVYNTYESSWFLYLPLMAGLFAGFKGYKNTMSILVTIGFLSVYVQNCGYNMKVNYKEQKLLNDYVIKEIPGFKYVITDRVNHDYGLLHSGFDTSSVKFVDYKSLDTFTFSQGYPQYLIGNGMTSYLSNTSWENLPEFAKTAHEKLLEVYKNNAGSVYKLK